LEKQSVDQLIVGPEEGYRRYGGHLIRSIDVRETVGEGELLVYELQRGELENCFSVFNSFVGEEP
jgi:hypothetical protein